MSMPEQLEQPVIRLERRELAENLAYLEKARFDCIDDLPAERVTFADPNYYKYKCRTNWWFNVSGRFERLLDKNLIDDASAQNAMKDFLAYVRTIDFQEFRTREEIERANKALDVVIPYLQAKTSARVE